MKKAVKRISIVASITQVTIINFALHIHRIRNREYVCNASRERPACCALDPPFSLWEMWIEVANVYRKVASPPVKRTILDLPTKLLLRVFSFLSLPSQACLAISSKRFHQLFGYVLEAEELNFPRTPRNGLAYITTEQYHIRMSLLIQLQNDNWACCGRCQRLHPSREFSSQQLVDYDPWNRACMAWAGIFDLCPCISLTVRDRTHTVEYLKSPKHRKPKLKSIHNGLLLSTGAQQLEHQCRAYPYV